MSDSNFLRDLTKDPNLFGILIGAALWIVGLYMYTLIQIIGVVLNTIGFTLTCFATAASALKRPVNQAWIGVLFGAVLYLLGPFIPLLNNIIFVAGAVMILFFAIPLALQTGKVPMMENLQEFLEENIKKKQEAPEVKSKEADTQTEEKASTAEEESESR